MLLAELEGEILPATQLAADPPQALQLVALGRAVALLPASLQAQIRRDVVCVLVRDAAPTRLLIAWPSERRSQALAAFVQTATEVARSAGAVR